MAAKFQLKICFVTWCCPDHENVNYCIWHSHKSEYRIYQKEFHWPFIPFGCFNFYSELLLPKLNHTPDSRGKFHSLLLNPRCFILTQVFFLDCWFLHATWDLLTFPLSRLKTEDDLPFGCGQTCLRSSSCRAQILLIHYRKAFLLMSFNSLYLELFYCLWELFASCWTLQVEQNKAAV